MAACVLGPLLRDRVVSVIPVQPGRKTYLIIKGFIQFTTRN